MLIIFVSIVGLYKPTKEIVCHNRLSKGHCCMALMASLTPIDLPLSHHNLILKQRQMLTCLYSCRDNRRGVNFLQLHAVQIDPYSLCLLEKLRVNNLLSYSLTCVLHYTKIARCDGHTLVCTGQIHICGKKRGLSLSTLATALLTLKLLTFFCHHLSTEFPQLLLDRLP